MTSRDFGAISLINGIMFMTANGSRSVLVPLHGVQAFGLTTTVMGAPRNALPGRSATAPLARTWLMLRIVMYQRERCQRGVHGSSKR